MIGKAAVKRYTLTLDEPEFRGLRGFEEASRFADDPQGAELEMTICFSHRADAIELLRRLGVLQPQASSRRALDRG